MPKVHPPSMCLGRISCRERPLYGASKYLMSAHENIHVEEATYPCHLSLLSCFKIYTTLAFCAHLLSCHICSHSPPCQLLTLWQISAYMTGASTSGIYPPLISIIWWQATNYDSIILYTHDVMASRGLQIYWRVNMLASLMECYSYSITLQYGVVGYLWYFSAVATPWFIFISTIK